MGVAVCRAQSGGGSGGAKEYAGFEYLVNTDKSACAESRALARRASPGRPHGAAIWLTERYALMTEVLGRHKLPIPTVGSPHHGPPMRGSLLSEPND